MRIASFLAAASAVLGLLPGHALAAPSPEVDATVKCDDISLYTFDHFHSHMCKTPPKASCLFYTRGLSKTARIYSKSDGRQLTTIWELWPRSWYDKRQITSNPLRCIMQDKNKRSQYFSAMSNAMAQTCAVFATVMDPNPDMVRVDGIWGKVEFPQLRMGSMYGKVDTIEAINADASKVNQNYWKRNASTKRDDNSTMEEAAELVRREACGIDGNDPAGDFDQGGSYPVDW